MTTERARRWRSWLWRLDAAVKRWRIVDGNREIVADVAPGRDDADVLLIVAAPRLLEACEVALAHLEKVEMGDSVAAVGLRYAIELTQEGES